MAKLGAALIAVALIFTVAGAPAPAAGGLSDLVMAGDRRPLYVRSGESFRVRLPFQEATGIRWYLVEQLPGPYDNVKACGPGLYLKSCHARVPYRALELTALRGLREFDGHRVPELARLGTKRVAVTYAVNGHRHAIPENFSDSMAPAAGDVEDFLRFPEVVVRSDDSYAGLLTELIGQPFVFYPVRLPKAGWQTDLRAGGDCIALVIYGRRRLGDGERYRAPKALRQDLAVRFTGIRFADLAEARVPVRRGDVLHFGFQTAVVYDVDGFLTPETLIIQSFYDGVAIKTLAELPYRGYDFDILTWEKK